MEDNELLKLVHQGQQLYLQAHDRVAYILEPIVSAIKSKKKLYSNPKVWQQDKIQSKVCKCCFIWNTYHKRMVEA